MVTSWRLKQLQQFYGGNAIIEQDARLIEFVKEHQIQRVCMLGEPDVEYFQERLPDVEVFRVLKQDQNFMLAIFKTHPYIKFENILQEITTLSSTHNPQYLYVARVI